MLGLLLWGIGASMALAEEEANVKTKNKEEELCEAKEIIKKLIGLYFAPIVTEEDLKKQDEIIKEAEQFIKE